eukprot:TRINITY_DN32683_c0_g1_i1.p1 TRINITY_DN32683_c0_g1~~TRINITY_DN32683_c0_g1_i1.p1  ORF type:complete len:913 (+),score=361.08 TRINITY_DN32683_c0_g1_i1:59-2740(+)
MAFPAAGEFGPTVDRDGSAEFDDTAAAPIGEASLQEVQCQQVRVVPLPFCLQYLETKVSRSRLLRDCLVYLPFLVMFVIFATAGRNVEADYYVDRVLRDRVLGNELAHAGSRRDGAPYREVQKTFEQIAAVEDFYDWMEGVLVPNLWQCNSTSGVEYLKQQGQNYLVGALRFRTLRASRRSCSPDTRIFLKEQEGSNGRAEVPEVCPAIPEGQLWQPPVFVGSGQVVPCFFVSGNEAVVTYRRRDPSSTATNPVIGVLPHNTRLNVVEKLYNSDPVNPALRDVRIAGPLSGWIYRYSPTGESVIKEDSCEVTCINCIGHFTSSSEETAMRFNVSNPLIRDVNERLLLRNRLYQHFTCDEMRSANRGGSYLIGDIAAYHCGGYVVDVPFNESCSSVQNLVDVLRGAKWLPGGAHETAAPFVDDVQSRLATAEYFTYSANFDTWSSVKVFIEVSPSGAVLPNYEFRHFKLWTEERNLSWTIYDFFFFAFVLYYLVKFVYDWKQCKLKTQKIFAFLMDAQQEAVWNLLDLANLVTLVVVFALRMVWWDECVKERSTYRFPIKYEYPPHLDWLKDLYMTQVYANSVNNVLSFLKLLKYAQLNDKLGVLTLTMSKAKDKIVGILLIFCWVVFAFSMCGETLYGSAIWGFRNLNSTYMSLMLALLGSFPTVAKGVPGEYDDMRRENRVLTFMFYWGYFILANVLLLNFIIGILAEAFSEANSEVRDVPFPEQVAKAMKSLRHSVSPGNLVALVRHSLRRRSRTAILSFTISNMQSHYEFLEREFQGQNIELSEIEEAQIHREKLKTFMGAEDYELLGPIYFDRLWDEVEEEYQAFIDNDPELEAQTEMKELLSSGITAAIDPRIQDICAMDGQMQELEMSVEEIIKDIFALRRKARSSR